MKNNTKPAFYGVDNKLNTNVSNSQNKISDFPKSYVKFNPSFGVSIEEKRHLEESIRDEQDKNDYLWAMGWDPVEAKKESELGAEKEIELRKKQAFVYLKSDTRRAIYEKYSKEYWDQKALYDLVLENRSYYEDKLKGDIKTRPRSTSEIMRSTKGAIDTKIAGYNALKRDMKEVFIAPVTKELLDGGEQKVANGILLCGPTGCGKTIAAEAIANETFCNVDRIPTDTNPRLFADVIKDKVDAAYDYYYQKQQEIADFKSTPAYQEMSQEDRDKELKRIGSPRTVVLIDEFDRYFNKLNVDERIIRENFNIVKQAFDGCSQHPRTGNHKAAALTFIGTTNYPKRIDNDININKLTPYAVLPPKGQDMEAVVRYYFTNANALIEEYMKYGESNLELINPDQINLKKFVEKYAPSEKDGAFSNDAIGFMVMHATESYIDNPKFDFNLHLIREFKYGLRDIRPEKLQRYIQELDSLGLLDDYEVPKIDDQKLSKKEILEQKIENLSSVPEVFLTTAQKEELAQMREELENLKAKD